MTASIELRFRFVDQSETQSNAHAAIYYMQEREIWGRYLAVKWFECRFFRMCIGSAISNHL